MSGVYAVTALAVASALTVGSTMALLGNLKLALARRPDQGDREVRFLLTLLNALLIPLLLTAGILVDYLGIRVMLMVGSVLLSLSFLSFSAGLNYRQIIIAAGGASVGASVLLISTILLMPSGLFGEREVVASLQFGLVLVALGALITPPLFDLLVDFIGFRRTAAVFSLLLIVPACLATLPSERQVVAEPEARARAFKEEAFALDEMADRATTEEEQQGYRESARARRADAAAAEQKVQDLRRRSFPARTATQQPWRFLAEPAVWAAALVFFFYAPLEAFVSVWTTTYLGNSEQTLRQSRWLAGFWLTMMASRLILGLVQHVGNFGDSNPSWFLIFPALLGAVILGNMSGATRSERALPGLLLLGFFLGPLYPMLLSMMGKMETVRTVPGTAFAFLHAAGSLGSLALAPLVNLSARARTVQMALRIPLFIALVLTAMTLMFALLADRVP